MASEAADARDPRGEAAALLREHGITPTAQRIGIAAVLLTHPRHVCAEALQQTLAERGTPVSKATVYNTLDLFARKGLVRELVVDPGKMLYDSNTTNHHHIYDVGHRRSDRYRAGSDRGDRTAGPPTGHGGGRRRYRRQDPAAALNTG